LGISFAMKNIELPGLVEEHSSLYYSYAIEFNQKK